MVMCIKELNRIHRCKYQWHCRPTVSIKEGCKEWWKYAARCHLGRDTLKPKQSWEDVLSRARENIRYIQIYTKLLGKSSKYKSCKCFLGILLYIFIYR